MNIKLGTAHDHPLLTTYRTANAAMHEAIRAQWLAYDAGGLAAFNVAHAAAGVACRVAAEAEQACYDAGIAHAPYWHVTPKQLDGYERANKAIANRTPAEKAEALHPYR